MWNPLDTQFYAPRLPVSLVAIDSHGTEFIRTVLESLRCVVHLHAIGTPTDFLQVIAQGDSARRYMIINGHGTEYGLHFGEYGPKDIDTSMLNRGSLPPEVIQKHVNLPDCTVLSHTCGGGEEKMARAFLSGNLSAYIGCRTEVDVVAANLFLFHLLYGVTAKKLSDRDAWHRAVLAVDHEEVNQVSFFHGDGSEERYVKGEHSEHSPCS